MVEKFLNSQLEKNKHAENEAVWGNRNIYRPRSGPTELSLSHETPDQNLKNTQENKNVFPTGNMELSLEFAKGPQK